MDRLPTGLGLSGALKLRNAKTEPSLCSEMTARKKFATAGPGSARVGQSTWRWPPSPNFLQPPTKFYLAGSDFARFTFGNLGGRAPLRTLPATGTYFNSTFSRAQRNNKPPRLKSPRPTNSAGNKRRSPKILKSGSIYFGVATLPKSTASQSFPRHSQSARPLRTRGER